MAKYQYATVVKTTKLDPPETLERMDQEQLDIGVTQGLHELVIQVDKMLLTPEMKGWEIVSHDLSFYGYIGIMTFLIRKARY